MGNWAIIVNSPDRRGCLACRAPLRGKNGNDANIVNEREGRLLFFSWFLFQILLITWTRAFSEAEFSETDSNETLLKITIISYRAAQFVPAWQPGCEKMEREWENEEEMEREWGNGEEMVREWGNGERFTLYMFSIVFLFPPSLSISYIKNCLILSQNVKYHIFVANVTKNLTYAHYEKIILCRILCEKFPQVVRGWSHTQKGWCQEIKRLIHHTLALHRRHILFKFMPFLIWPGSTKVDNLDWVLQLVWN